MAAPTPHSTDGVDLTVVIVNYNVRDFLDQALRSVFGARADLEMQVIVVDNDSVDGSVQLVSERFPEVEVIANRENLGFGRANNQALQKALGRHILILNPDTIVGEDALQTMVAFMDARPEAGACGCRILNPDGTFARESRRAFPTPTVALYRLTGLSRLFPRSARFGRYNMSFVPENVETEVDALSGSCMMVRREALFGERGAGLFDTDFFMYGEDLDLCYRIQQAGWKIYYTPDAEIIHYKGESTRKGELRYVKLFYGAMVLFTEKHLHGRYTRLFAWALQSAILARAGVSVVTRFLRRIALPATDFATVLGLVATLGWVRSASLGVAPAPLFFATVAPAFALASVLGIAAAGGYARPARTRAVLIGVPIGFLAVAAASFFVPAIAFSRLVVLAALPAGLAVLLAIRVWRRARPAGERSALLVGPANEAARLQTLVDAHPHPPFRLVGRVGDEENSGGGDEEDSGSGDGENSGGDVRVLGSLRQLRDAVRVHRIDDVVFATGALPNERIFGLMQRLSDLPVQFRMLAEGASSIIGKAQVSHLDLKNAVSDAPSIRSAAARRLSGLLLGIPLLIALPAARLFGRAPTPAGVSLWQVLRGRCALVGYAPQHRHLIQSDWRLKPGLFNISVLIEAAATSDDALARAYGYYATHQSAALDAEIVARSLMAR